MLGGLLNLSHFISAGAGIAQVAAAAGLCVHLIDRSYDQLDRAKAGVLDSLKRLAGKGKLPEGEVQATLDRIQPGVELEVGDSLRCGSPQL